MADKLGTCDYDRIGTTCHDVPHPKYVNCVNWRESAQPSPEPYRGRNGVDWDAEFEYIKEVDARAASQPEAGEAQCPHLNMAGHEHETWCMDCGQRWLNPIGAPATLTAREFRKTIPLEYWTYEMVEAYARAVREQAEREFTFTPTGSAEADPHDITIAKLKAEVSRLTAERDALTKDRGWERTRADVNQKAIDEVFSGWRFKFNMYRSAWLREIGGTIKRKTHEIDGFVLMTREIKEKADRCERAEAALREARDKAQNIVRLSIDIPSTATSFFRLAQCLETIAAEARTILALKSSTPAEGS